MTDPIPPTIEWRDGVVRLIDQRRLPDELTFIECRTVDELCEAIASLAVRGAPALGAAGAMGVALAARNREPLDAAGARLRATRPTAVNLAWGVDRAVRADDAEAEAIRVAADDVERNRRMGAHGAALLQEGVRPFTHCNTGSLACVGWGTALGVVRAAHEAGLRPRVWVGETRPVLQGARLTAWELSRLAIPHTLVADGAAASLMAAGEVDCVLLGADRIAANGDVANKVGTYGLAVLARHHGVAFYVVAPRSTFDPTVPDGAAIPIERRPPDEVLSIGGHRVAPEGTPADNRAFDITPAALVTAYVTEDGVHRQPPSDQQARPGVGQGPHAREEAGVGAPAGGAKRPATLSHPVNRVPSVLLPTTCPGCGARGPAPCPRCTTELRRAPALAVPPSLDTCTALLAYEGVGRELVARLKYRNARAAAGFLATAMAALVDPGDVDVVTWAPTTAARRRRRGFDQAALLARLVARRMGRPCRPLLVRPPGPPQTGRAGAARRLPRGFEARAPGRCRTRRARVLLVDDVVTTGATMTAAARALRAAGATAVHGLAAARTPLKLGGQ